MAYSGKKLNLANDYLLNYIKTNSLTVGDRLPTEREMIEASGVSRVTLRRAIANLQADGIINTIQGSGIYVAKTMGLPQISEPVPMVLAYDGGSSRILDIVEGAQDFLFPAGCRLNVTVSGRSPETERQILQSLYDSGVRNAIIFPVSSVSNNDFYFKLIQKGMNIVFVDRRPQDLISCNLVQSDNATGGYIATKHLIEKGHKKIATFGVEPMELTSAVRERVFGYLTAMKEAGLPVPEQYYYYSPYQKENEQVQKLFSPENGFTAVFAMHDGAAIDLIRHAKHHGCKVPNDISVVGFDNQNASMNCSPALTTVEQPFRLLGEAAAKIIYNNMLNEAKGFTQTILPVKLIERKSTCENTK